jgi:mono/diheme cytochrome c family protein
MRHVIVRRSALLLALLFFGAAGVFTWMVGPTPGAVPTGTAPQPAAAAFEQHCGTCHTVAELAATLRNADTVKRMEIERLLVDHGDAPPGDDRLILDYLATAGPDR